MDWSGANPLSFVKLLSSGATLAKLTVALGLQCIAEPRFLLPYVQLMWASYGYSPNKIGKPLLSSPPPPLSSSSSSSLFALLT